MKISGKIALVFALVLLVIPAKNFAAEMDFENIYVVDDKVRVSFAVKGYQRKDILEAIKRGIEVKIVYDIQIVAKSAVFFLGESVVYDKTILRSVKYDFWNKAYQVKEGQKKNLFQGDNSMLDYFFSVRNYDLIDVNFMKRPGYTIRAKAELKTVELYFPMNLIFKYFVKFWDFKTGWKKGPSPEF